MTKFSMLVSGNIVFFMNPCSSEPDRASEQLQTLVPLISKLVPSPEQTVTPPQQCSVNINDISWQLWTFYDVVSVQKHYIKANAYEKLY